MDKRYIVLGGALLIGAAVAYYISSRQPQEDFYASSGGSGSGSGSIVLPPAPVSNTYNTSYDLKFPDVPQADLSGLGGNAKPDYVSKSSGSGGSSSGSSNYSAGQSVDPSISFKNTLSSLAQKQAIASGVDPKANSAYLSGLSNIQNRANQFVGPINQPTAPAQSSSITNTYNKLAAAVPGIPTTGYISNIISKWF